MEFSAHSSGHRSAFTLPPSTWCPAVAAPQRKPSGNWVTCVSSPALSDDRLPLPPSPSICKPLHGPEPTPLRDGFPAAERPPPFRRADCVLADHHSDPGQVLDPCIRARPVSTSMRRHSHGREVGTGRVNENRRCTSTFSATATESDRGNEPSPSKSHSTDTMTPVPSGTCAVARNVTTSPTATSARAVTVHGEGHHRLDTPAQ